MFDTLEINHITSYLHKKTTDNQLQVWLAMCISFSIKRSVYNIYYYKSSYRKLSVQHHQLSVTGHFGSIFLSSCTVMDIQRSVISDIIICGGVSFSALCTNCVSVSHYQRTIYHSLSVQMHESARRVMFPIFNAFHFCAEGLSHRLWPTRFIIWLSERHRAWE